MTRAALVEGSLAIVSPYSRCSLTPITSALDPWNHTLVRFGQKLNHTGPREGRGNPSTSMGGGRVACSMEVLRKKPAKPKEV